MALLQLLHLQQSTTPAHSSAMNHLSSFYWPWPLASSTTAGAGAMVVVLWFLIRRFTSQRTQTPRLPPGPRGLPLVGNLLSLDPQLQKHFWELSKSYGPIFTVKLGRKTAVVVTSHAIAREILKNHDAVFANHDVPAAARELTYGGVGIVWSPYGPTWRKLRRACAAEMVSAKSLDAVYPLRRRELRRLIRYLYGQASLPVNIAEQVFLTSLNVITSMMWGGTVMNGGEEERKSVAEEFRKLVREMVEMLGKPNVSDFFPVLKRFDLQGIQKKMKRLVIKMDRIFDNTIEQKLGMKEGKESMDFLQVLLQMKEKDQDKTPLAITNIKASLVDIIVGGTDTTSNTIEFVLAEMMNNPQVLQKVHQELDAVVGKDRMPEESHISNLPYLHSVVKETLRLHAPVPLLVPHVPSAACTIAGYMIPKGTPVFINAWAIHRDPSVWENPLEFWPERFESGRWDYSGNEFIYLPFGSGRRSCVGMAMAERMVMHALASLVHSFDWSLPEGEELELEENSGITLKKKRPLMAIPTPRLDDNGLYETIVV